MMAGAARWASERGARTMAVLVTEANDRAIAESGALPALVAMLERPEGEGACGMRTCGADTRDRGYLGYTRKSKDETCAA